MSFETYTISAKSLNSKINSAIRTAKKQRETLHVLLVAAAIHVEKHGDTRPITRLVTGLKEDGSHIRVNAMIRVLNEYTPLHFDTKELKFRVVKGREWNIQGLIDDPFYSSKKAEGKEGAEWEVQNYLKAVLRNLDKHEVNVKDFARQLVEAA